MLKKADIYKNRNENAGRVVRGYGVKDPLDFKPNYNRPSPPEPASIFGNDKTFSVGNDGNLYTNVKDKNGVWRWKKVKEE